MKQTLEQLWYGNIRPFAQARCDTPEMNELLQKIEKSRDALCQTLTDEQKELFLTYDDIAEEISAIGERESFIHGFRLGAKMTAETFYEEKK